MYLCSLAASAVTDLVCRKLENICGGHYIYIFSPTYHTLNKYSVTTANIKVGAGGISKQTFIN